ncbi:hypothetical protein EKO27_g7970 [Xylaria grammica]|uniref:RRM domain-containing protein n=1 Tax=Xylaria grammica TaxID=363999 RepID=A0A439CY30_9PEZI|nr:hypothetical protein EKO27_g7970 [Xylaria grammica]
MSNQDKQAVTKGRDLSGPWRPGIVTPASTGNADTPKTPNSSNYRGDLTNPRNKSADIPDEENCGTWWTNLPPNCTYEMLFDSMRNIGAVSHAIINPPVGTHGTSAAKVEFFERASVDRLMAQTKTGHIRGHIRVGGRIPHITLNRIKVTSHSNILPIDQGNGGRGSRVLQVIGDPRVVQKEYLEATLANPQNRIIYGLEKARTFQKSGGRCCVELRFASYTVQAARAREIFLSQKRRGEISAEERALWEGVTCLYAPDPCA